MVRLRVLVLVVVALAIAGCAPDVRAAAPATTTSSLTSAFPATTLPSTATPTTTSTTSRTPYVFPPFPLDGSNLKACEDAVCEVRVKRNATIKVGAGRPTFTIVKISAAGVDFRLRYPDGRPATLTLGPESGSFAGFGAPMSFEISLYSVDEDGTAVLRVGPLTH
ncbi:hypothetical protein EV193_101410 [Herbihabitans rhizosphaerae]|uniref:Uncharacterized protein n=1 Tax=Herbihabitans rhizosphaerae TaxID=1872711 RepID=A0A4Q7L5I5_9PSEU|nr:hypothetical protein [Herbihabitans rhizosphaerae]RZS44534.1 hypothetical protein EV193_101410 [Herbihabitans rhizosphaerae]